MDFNFKKQEQEIGVIMEKKIITNGESKVKNFTKRIMMNFSVDKIYPGIWSVLTLLIGVIAVHYRIEKAEWIIPFGCLLYYFPNRVVPFTVMLVSLLGMALGIPKMVFILIFGLITMVDWSGLE